MNNVLKRACSLWTYALVLVGFSSTAAAYSVKTSDMLVRPVVGASVNMLRFPAATRATPQGGMILGADFDWHFSDNLALTTQLRPAVSAQYVDGNLGVGVKARLVELQAPFIPYASAVVVGAVGGPLGFGDVHTNVGLRLAGGVDYFVLRDLAVGVEAAGEATALLTPVLTPEASTDILIGLTWRL